MIWVIWLNKQLLKTGIHDKIRIASEGRRKRRSFQSQAQETGVGHDTPHTQGHEMEARPKIAIRNEGSISVLELLDEEILDESTISAISESLFSVLEDQNTEHMILSFVRVKHLSSMALGMLIRLNKKVEEGGGLFKLCDIKPSLYEIFRITKLDKLLAIYDTCDQAIDSFG